MAAPSSWVKEGAVGSLPKETTWRRPDESVGDERMLSGLAGAAAGLCFNFRNSSLRLAFLLIVDGLFFFQTFSWETEWGAISLVSREKEKLEPRVREKENAIPWLASALQKSKHLLARGDSSPLAEAVIVKSYF